MNNINKTIFETSDKNPFIELSVWKINIIGKAAIGNKYSSKIPLTS